MFATLPQGRPIQDSQAYAPGQMVFYIFADLVIDLAQLAQFSGRSPMTQLFVLLAKLLAYRTQIRLHFITATERVNRQ